MRIKMRQLSIFSFSLVIMVVLIIVLVLIYQQKGVVSEGVITNAESDFIDEISSRLDEYFDVPELIINSQCSTFTQMLLDFDKDDEVAKHFSFVINALPKNIYSFTYGTQQGAFYGARRIDDTTQFYKSDNSTGGHSYYYFIAEDYSIKEFSHDFGAFDPRTREWYKSALVNDEMVFSSIYEHFVMKDMTLSASKAVFSGNEVVGVLGVHMTLSLISDFIKQESMHNAAKVYIIDNNTGKLLASNSDAPNFIEVDDTTIRAVNVDEIDDGDVISAYQNHYKSQTKKKDNEGRVRISSTGYRKGNLDLQIITLIPENQYLSYLTKSFVFLLVGTASVLLIGIFIWSRVNKMALTPLDQLVSSINLFAVGVRQFKIKESSIVEFDRLSNAFLDMSETISDHIQKLEALNKEYDDAKLTAENANKAKSLFLANMSHEIRTPLNGIIGFSDIIAQTPLCEDQIEMVDVIRASSRSLLEIINDILDISRIEAGKIEVNLACTDLSSMLNQNILMFTALATKRDLKFVSDIPKDLPRFIMTDEIKLNQIIVNLLGNAIKYTDAGEVVFKVRVVETNDDLITVAINVQDTGIGIKPEDIDSIFDLFVQSDISKDKKSSGTGLGLTIVKELVGLLNAEIEVKSDFGVGSIFTVTLITKSVDACNDLRKEQVKIEYSISQPKILLVEDDKVSQLLIRKISDLFKWELTVASSGFEALRIMENHAFDIILMDIQMPEMNGLKVTQIIRSKEMEGYKATIIGMSAYAMQSNVREALDAGMNDYITKPIDFTELNRLILKHLSL